MFSTNGEHQLKFRFVGMNDGALSRNNAPRRRASNLTGANPVWLRVSHPPVASLAWQSVTTLLEIAFSCEA